MPNVAVVGSQWGDEGKGKIVDWLSEKADVIVRFQGGHSKSKMIFDILVSKKEIKIFSKRKIRTKNTHGTGCTLSSALATCLSQKKNVIKSCKISLRYVDKAIASAPGYGKGFGPLNHLVSFNLRNINV